MERCAGRREGLLWDVEGEANLRDSVSVLGRRLLSSKWSSSEESTIALVKKAWLALRLSKGGKRLDQGSP